MTILNILLSCFHKQRVHLKYHKFFSLFLQDKKHKKMNARKINILQWTWFHSETNLNFIKSRITEALLVKIEWDWVFGFVFWILNFKVLIKKRNFGTILWYWNCPRCLIVYDTSVLNYILVNLSLRSKN